MAWLQAVPKPPAGSKRAAAEADRPQVSRIAQMKVNKIAPQMPPNPMPHIIAWFIEIGITQSTGMGPGPLSWGELDDWQRQVAVTLSPWEVRLLRQLSVTFISESQKAECENCPSPWCAEVTPREIALETAGLQMVLG